MSYKFATPEQAARMLISNTKDSSSQGRPGCVNLRSADRLGGIIGMETEVSLCAPPNEKCINPISTTAGIDFVRSVVSVARGMVPSHATRLNIKVIARNNVISGLSVAAQDAGATIEGIINIGQEHSLVYIGYNHASRIRTPIDPAKLLTEAQSKAGLGLDPLERESVLNAVAANGHISYTLIDNNATSVSPAFFDDISALLSTFQYSRDNALENVTSPSNTVVLASGPDGRIIGIAVAEKVPLRMDSGKTFNLIELTDFVVRKSPNSVSGPTYYSTGKTSYVMTSILLHHILGDSAADPCSIFAEANISNHMITTFATFGAQIVGILPHHVNIVNSSISNLYSFALMQFQPETLDTNLINALRR